MGVGVGIDFGTSNSAAALSGDGPGAPARVLSLDLEGDDVRLLRSVLFFPETSTEILVGAAAIRRYLDEGSGRFLQSAKSFLHQSSFDFTEIRRRSYRLQELVAFVLRRIRERIELEAGAPIDRLILGRPAAFAPEPERDAIAERRLLAAAGLAGLPPPTLLIEPIAAALGYESTLDDDETVLVGDFGAGTSDFTLMRLGPGRRGSPNRRGDVIASGGVRVGGDRFDAAIVEQRLLPRFGARARYKVMGRWVPMPAWIPRKLLAWHELSLLREKSNLDFLHGVVRNADDPEAVSRLVTLAEENLAFHLYRSVETAKRELSVADRAVVSFHEGAIDLDEPVTRAEFESWTAPLRDELTVTVDRVLSAAGGVEPDAVFLTGGSSKIPAVRTLFAARFGEARIREGDAFTSVAAGLGRAAAADSALV